MQQVYLDYAASTPIDPRVKEAMEPFLTSEFGNPSSQHSFGKSVAREIEKSRTTIASAINASSTRELLFTSGASESNNMAIAGIALGARVARGDKAAAAGHIITSAIEHKSALVFKRLMTLLGFESSVIYPNKEGFIEASALAAELRENTLLVTTQFVNNEIGNIQPIKELAALAHSKGAYFHCDAAQAFGKIDVDVRELDVDSLALSAHKIYGPKGVGALYLKKKTPFIPISFGGGQEFDKRHGTENTVAIVGFAKAAEIAINCLKLEYERIKSLRSDFYTSMGSIIDSQGFDTRANIVANFLPCFVPGIENSSIVIALDRRGFSISSGAACVSKNTGSKHSSHVLSAMNLDEALLQSFLRISFGRPTTKENVRDFVGTLKEIIKEKKELEK
jgi:cysteine desulfurase